MRDAADRIYKNGRAEKADILKLLSCTDDGDCQYLFEKAREVSQRTFGKNVYIRGLIEFTSYCKKRLPVLRTAQKQQPCLKIPPDGRRNSPMLRKRIQRRLQNICSSGRR